MNTLRKMLFRGIVTCDTITHSVPTVRATQNPFFCALEFSDANDSGVDPGGRAV